ncbi:MAG TPA: glycosyltransferase [Anaerolineae bacterium]|nr:glycosyltransferase [Anaerolineae bacterium]HPL30776.1 glycosyltransferase [Anaerolineae bacterium]
MRELRPLGEHGAPERQPSVSILVPARNEEASVGRCLRSLLAQDYPDYEVIAIDDNSEDRTGEILAGLAAQSPRLTALQGAPLPPGWLGKNWACQQLVRQAHGELLLFTDADTCHHPRALADAVAALEAQRADLLTAFPQQETVTWAERLIVPGMMWTFLLFMPLRLAYRSPKPGLSVTCGQFMLFRRLAYERIGGHDGVRQEVIEDMILGRRIKEQGLRWRVADGCPRVRCRMYHNLREVLDGFGKNMFAGFQYNISAYLLGWLFAAALVLEPLAVLALWLLGAALPGAAVALAGGAVGATLLLIGASYRRFGFRPYLALVYPLTLAIVMGIAVYSVVLALTGRSYWKGRQIARPKIRLW